MSYPPGLSVHLGRAVTTVCFGWRVTRRDGAVCGFTDHDLPLTVDGTALEPGSGFSGSEARETLGFGVDAVDVEGALSSGGIDPDDVAAGLYDGATVETFLVNWRQPSDFALLRTATIGRTTRSDGRFVAELEGRKHALDQPSGRYLRRHCDAELGDARCGFALSGPAHVGAGAVNAVVAPDTIVASGLSAFPLGWLSNGVLTWSGGAEATRQVRVIEHRRQGGDDLLVLWREQGAAPQVGDAFTVVSGCDKTFSTCREKFANALNFRGFPHLPGNDAAYAYVSEEGVFDGAPLVP